MALDLFEAGQTRPREFFSPRFSISDGGAPVTVPDPQRARGTESKVETRLSTASKTTGERGRGVGDEEQEQDKDRNKDKDKAGVLEQLHMKLFFGGRRRAPQIEELEVDAADVQKIVAVSQQARKQNQRLADLQALIRREMNAKPGNGEASARGSSKPRGSTKVQPVTLRATDTETMEHQQQHPRKPRHTATTVVPTVAPTTAKQRIVQVSKPRTDKPRLAQVTKPCVIPTAALPPRWSGESAHSDSSRASCASESSSGSTVTLDSTKSAADQSQKRLLQAPPREREPEPATRWTASAEERVACERWKRKLRNVRRHLPWEEIPMSFFIDKHILEHDDLESACSEASDATIFDSDGEDFDYDDDRRRRRRRGNTCNTFVAAFFEPLLGNFFDM